MNNAQNALLAKAHALYAKALTDEDYNALLACRSNYELIGYLKANTAYSEGLEGTAGSAVSRAKLEYFLRQFHFHKMASLCRFEKLIGENLYKYLITKSEIETIIYCARHLDTDTITDLFSVPEFYKKEQSVFAEDMCFARSFEDLASYLKGTEYGRIFEALNAEKAPAVLPAVENALYSYLYTQAEEIVKKGFKGKEREEILGYFRFASDMVMIDSLYRLNKNYSLADNYKASAYISPVSAFTQKEKEKMLSADSGEEIIEIVRSSAYKKYFSGADDGSFEGITRSAFIKMCLKNLRYSQNPMVCMLCYASVSENEIKNIIHIIEGIKYNLSPEEISEIIVKGDC